MIVYWPLFWLMKKKGIGKLRLRDSGLSGCTIAKLSKDGSVIDSRTIEKLCKYLKCQPNDIMSYIPDDVYECYMIRLREIYGNVGVTVPAVYTSHEKDQD